MLRLARHRQYPRRLRAVTPSCSILTPSSSRPPSSSRKKLLAAKRDLPLPRALRRLDGVDAIILDDLGFVQQSAEEVEVLFTLMTERYERRSMIITSNLVFGEWDEIFKNSMTTAAAIDHIVHHSVILEFDGPSIRAEEARKRNRKDQPQPNA